MSGMKERLSKALEPEGGTSVERILAAAFFRSRPLQAGTSAIVARLVVEPSPRRGPTPSAARPVR
jgi:hypothetical protein